MKILKNKQNQADRRKESKLGEASHLGMSTYLFIFFSWLCTRVGLVTELKTIQIYYITVL